MFILRWTRTQSTHVRCVHYTYSAMSFFRFVRSLFIYSIYGNTVKRTRTNRIINADATTAERKTMFEMGKSMVNVFPSWLFPGSCHVAYTSIELHTLYCQFVFLFRLFALSSCDLTLTKIGPFDVWLDSDQITINCALLVHSRIRAEREIACSLSDYIPLTSATFQDCQWIWPRGIQFNHDQRKLVLIK